MEDSILTSALLHPDLLLELENLALWGGPGSDESWLDTAADVGLSVCDWESAEFWVYKQ